MNTANTAGMRTEKDARELAMRDVLKKNAAGDGGEVVSSFPITTEQLDPNRYTQALLAAAREKGLLSDTQQQAFGNDLLQLLAVVTRRYTREKSSSVPVGVAEMLFASALYCIDYCLKPLSPQRGLELLETEGVAQLYARGLWEINRQLRRCKLLLLQVEKTEVPLPLICYGETMDQISDFLSIYRPEVDALALDFSIDYPLYLPLERLWGIAYLTEYLKALLCENRVCGRFPRREIAGLLSQYSRPYGLPWQSLGVNLFEITLTNALGAVWLGRSPMELSLSEEDGRVLAAQLASLDKEGFQLQATQVYKQLREALQITSQETLAYLRKAAASICRRLYHSAKTGEFAVWFICRKEQPEAMGQKLYFQDDNTVSNAVFCRIAEEISREEDMEKKLAILSGGIHSIYDLADLLETGCFWTEDYPALFASLGDLELAVLLRLLPQEEQERFLARTPAEEPPMEPEKDWDQALLRYLDGAGAERLEQVLSIYGMLEM